MQKIAKQRLLAAALTIGTIGGITSAQAQVACPVSYDALKAAVTQAAAADSTGFNNDYWAVAVNRGGNVCAVAYSGASIDAQWLGSRQIAAAKAYTANAFSLSVSSGRGPLSTAQLYGFRSAVPERRQPALRSRRRQRPPGREGLQRRLLPVRHRAGSDARLPDRRHDHLRRRPRPLLRQRRGRAQSACRVIPLVPTTRSRGASGRA